MPSDIATLFSTLRSDPWREQSGFADDFTAWNTRIAEVRTAEQAVAEVNNWLQKFQPCLFGRLAAKAGAITYCVLDETDLGRTDEQIQSKIQDSRLAWSRAAYQGKSSAFVIFVASPRIAGAIPDENMGELARRLAFLYLRRDIDFDHIYTDEIALEFPGEKRLTRLWQTGVNYFCAQGDSRWWQDHRIPGGMAFSVNSVGHLVRSGRLLNAFDLLSSDLGEHPSEGFRIDSLDKALEFAMRTIHMASEGPSGKATRLLPTVVGLPECPVRLPSLLADKNHCTYWGAYHTDVTLPAEYFRSDVERPHDLPTHNLDFTYLFGKDTDNPDFELMGEGRRIRTDSAGRSTATYVDKHRRGVERVVDISDTVLLKEALGLTDHSA